MKIENDHTFLLFSCIDRYLVSLNNVIIKLIFKKYKLSQVRPHTMGISQCL